MREQCKRFNIGYLERFIQNFCGINKRPEDLNEDEARMVWNMARGEEWRKLLAWCKRMEESYAARKRNEL
jgi:hypothetical protein